jgi:SMI1-KNR4 cell-wall
MDDIIQELRRRSESIPVKLDLPTDDDLLDAEEQIFLTFPAQYREFLLEVSDVVLGSVEPATAADPQSHTYIPDMAAEAWLVGLPRHLIPICRMGNGYFCIDEGGVVSLWQKGKFSEQEWESIWDWAYDVWLGHSE